MRMVWIALLVVGCATTSTDDSSAVVLGDCPWAGSWQLTEYWCGTTNITIDWMSHISSTTVHAVEDSRGGCNLAFAFDTPGVCHEEASWVFPEPDVTPAVGSSAGISSCDPEGCVFNAVDAPCVVGDRAGPRGGEFTRTATRLTLEAVSDVCAFGTARLVFESAR